MTESKSMVWSLEVLYPSFESKEFTKDCEMLDFKINQLIKWSDENFSNWDNLKTKLEDYLNMKNSLVSLSNKLTSYASLSFSADSGNTNAKKYIGIIEKKLTNLTSVDVRFSSWVSKIENIEALMNSSEIINDHAFYLFELKKQDKYILSENEEIIISKMKLTSSSAWAKFKNLITADHMVDIEIAGKTESIGINKIKNMYFSKDKELRKKAFYAELEANKNIEESVAAALNGIKGEVLTICDLKGFESPLHKTLETSRMDQETLETMLKVMKENLGEFQRYFIKKAELLGHKNKLPYYDVMAPIGAKDMEFTYDQAHDFIVKHFNTFSESFGSMADKAFKDRWIDAEIRDGKRGGAFCSQLHSVKESRILCSFEGSFKNVCTLAHELGHAYHGMIMQNESELNSSYPMPLAETASIFAENIVRKAAIDIADKEEALVILGAELVNCCSVIVDIYARYLFETEFFNRRKNGDVPVSEIKEIMIWAQKEAYGEEVDPSTFDPYAWMHKPHYYYAERNFYNFPYAFGLLFSKGLYSMYLKEGSKFVNKYNEILRLTGKASVYDVAKFADIDLHNEEFWKGSMEIIKRDIEKFCTNNI